MDREEIERTVLAAGTMLMEGVLVAGFVIGMGIVVIVGAIVGAIVLGIMF